MSKDIHRPVLAVAVITAFITTFTGSALNLSIPDIGAEFNVSAEAVGWLITGYTLSVAAFSVPFGRIADMTERRKILITGIAVFSVCCAAAFFSVSAFMITAVRMIQGIGAAMIFSTNTAVLISSFPEENRGRVIGYSLASTYAGLSSGPVIGGILNQNLGWRSIFILTGILAVISFFIAWKKLPDEKSETGKSLLRKKNFDMRGNVLYIGFIVMLMYGLSEAASSTAGKAIAGAGMMLGIIFIRHEFIVDEPVVDVRLFRDNRGYAFSNLAALMNYGATFAVSYLISIYIQETAGYSSQTAGFIMAAQPLVMAAFSPLMGAVSDKVSPFKLASAGMGLCAAGTFIFIFVGEDTSVLVIIIALVVTGMGFALFSSPNTNAVMSFVEEKNYGSASSILATMRSIGHTISMVIVTITVNVYMDGVSLSQASSESLIKVISTSFIIFTIICAAGIVFSLKRK